MAEKNYYENNQYGSGIFVAGNIDIGGIGVPADSRLMVENLEKLAWLVENKRVYDGMIVYCKATGTYHKCSVDWNSDMSIASSSWKQVEIQSLEELKALIASESTAAMEFKGTIKDGNLPTLEEGKNYDGNLYKVATKNVTIPAALNAEEEAEVVAKPGDSIVCEGGKWYLIPSGDDIEDTWRAIKVNGVEKLGGGITSGDVDFVQGDNVTITEAGGVITIAAADTHYESKLVAANSATDAVDETAEDGYVHLNLVEEGVVKSSHKIVGGGGISVTHTAAGGEDGVNVITIEAAEGAKYDLTAKTETTGDNKDEAYLSLTGTDNSEDKVYVVGEDAVTVTVDGGKIKVSAHDTKYTGSTTDDIKVEVVADGKISAELSDGVHKFIDDTNAFIDALQGDMAAKSGYVGADQFNSTIEGLQGEYTAIKGRLDVVETALGADGAVNKAIADAKAEAIVTADKDATEKVVVALAEAQKYADAGVDALEVKLASGEDNFTVKYAEHAVNADSAESALQDNLGNVITDTYETKEDANAKLAEAKKYTDELVEAIPAQIDYTVSVSVREDEEGDDHTALKHYILEQCGNEIGHIDIPRDLVVEEGHVKEVEEADKPYAGAVVGEKYIELKIKNQKEPIYIPAKDLVEYISVEDTDTIDLTLTAEHVLTADVKANSIGTGHLTTEVNTSLGLANSALQSVTIAGHELTKAGKTAVSADEIATALDLANKYQAKGDYASAAQGTKADTALQKITTTEGHGLKVTNNNNIDIDTDVVFVLDCNW